MDAHVSQYVDGAQAGELFKRKKELEQELTSINTEIQSLPFKPFCGRELCEPGDCEHV